MVSIKIDAGEGCELEIVGDLDIITSEVTFAIGSIYEQIKKNNEEAAEKFREGLESALEDGFLFMSDKERYEFLKERTKKTTRRELREAEKRVKDLLESILGGEEDD